MKRLFVELYLDEDVSVPVAELLRSHGFDVLTAREAGQLSKSDEEQLAYAVSQSRALVSHNRSDFETLAQQYFAAERTLRHHSANAPLTLRSYAQAACHYQ